MVVAAKQRLDMDGGLRALGSEASLQPGGRFEGRPLDFALNRYNFFECSECGEPYFGGQRQCGAGVENNQEGKWMDRGERSGMSVVMMCGGCLVMRTLVCNLV